MKEERGSRASEWNGGLAESDGELDAHAGHLGGEVSEDVWRGKRSEVSRSAQEIS